MRNSRPAKPKSLPSDHRVFFGLAISVLLAASLFSCGGTTLRTLEAEFQLDGPGLKLGAILYDGDIKVLNTLPAGSSRIEATSIIKDKIFVWNFMEGAAKAEEMDLRISVDGTTVSILTGSTNQAVNLSFELEIRVPSDYAFGGCSLYTGGGLIDVSGMRGSGFFEFKSYADSTDVDFPVRLNGVEGDIWIENSQGDIVIAGCGPILYAVGAGKIDAQVLSYPHGEWPRIEAGKGIAISISQALSLGFVTPSEERDSVKVNDPALNTRTVEYGGSSFIDVYSGQPMVDWYRFAYRVSTLKGSVVYTMTE